MLSGLYTVIGIEVCLNMAADCKRQQRSACICVAWASMSLVTDTSRLPRELQYARIAMSGNGKVAGKRSVLKTMYRR